MPNELVNYWKRWNYTVGMLKVHPDDVDWMTRNWKGPLESEQFKNLREYTRSPRFGANDSDLHLSLLPVPFVGNLENAKVIIFLANPGFTNADYYLAEQHSFSDLFLRNLRQENDLEFPFVYLDPEFAWSAAFEWWESRLRPIITELTLRDRSTYLDSLRKVAQNIAVVEMFPYHSVNGNTLKGISPPSFMPSVAKAREFFRLHAGNKNQLTLLMRKHGVWRGDSKLELAKHYLEGPRVQGLTFNPKYDIGKAIMDWLAVNE